MAPSRVIRIDAEVWAELKRRARPLEDTPSSVLRRVFGLPEAETEADSLEPRIAKLLESVRGLVGQTPQVSATEKGCAFLSEAEGVVAYLRPQRERLRITASKGAAENAGLNNWDNQRQDKLFGGPGVRWYAPDRDDAAYQRVAAVLARLWRGAS